MVVRGSKGGKGSVGYVILHFRVPTTSAKGREGTEGISIVGFRVPTTCGGKGEGRIKGE